MVITLYHDDQVVTLIMMIVVITLYHDDHGGHANHDDRGDHAIS